MLWRTKPQFVYPIPPAPRTAILTGPFRSRGSLRVFDDGDRDAVRGFAPQALAGTLAQLEALAGEVSLTHAVIVFRSEWEAPLTEAQRDRLWRAFQVPAFEQMLGPGGSLLATECEAHDGLHIVSPRLAVGDHEIDVNPCACGRPTARMVTRAGAMASSAGR